MSQFKRRDFLKISAGLAAGAGAPLIWMKHAHAQWNNAPEKGARLRVLRWSRFVQGDIDQYLANVKKLEAKYDIAVRVDNESWEDVRPKAAVAANTGAGPDIILGTNDDANLYPEKLRTLKYSRELYGTFVPCTLSWLDPNNNTAFLDGQISVTNNGISIYYAAKTSQDPKIKELVPDINHAEYPVGPAGVGTAFHLFLNQMIFKYTKYPRAAKEFIRFMMEEEQYGPWMQASIGYVAHPLAAYAANPIWTSDPKHTPYRDVMMNMRPAGYEGKLGYASAGVLADFIMVDMVAEAASGAKSPKAAAESAQKRAERYYKV